MIIKKNCCIFVLVIHGTLRNLIKPSNEDAVNIRFRGYFIFMTELSLFKSNEATMSSREIAVVTNKHHSHVSRDIRAMLNALEISESPFLVFDNSGGLNRKVGYYELPKRECLILASGYNVKLRAKIIDRWIELETKEKQQLPSTFSEALQLAADQAKQLELQAPKVESFDKFIDTKTLQGFKEVANLLGMGRNTLMSELRNMKILTINNLPYQNFINMGLFEVKESTQNGFNRAVTYTTAKGIDYIRKKTINKLHRKKTKSK